MPLIKNRYGKGRVRVMRIHRDGDRQEVSQLNVKAMMEGDFAPAYTHGDNSTSVSTDTIKNVVNIVARENTGLSTEEFNLGWVARYTSPLTKANVQLVTRDAAAPEDSVISVHTDDVEGAYAEAQKLGYEIVHPITTEAWGVRRFFVRAPDGTVINIVNHRD